MIHQDVVLSSGQRATWYIDLRRLLLDGSAAPLAGQVMLELTSDLPYDAASRAYYAAFHFARALAWAACACRSPACACASAAI